MKTLITLGLSLFTLICFSQSEEDLIKQTLNYYLEGSSYNDMELIEKAFYEEAPLFLSKEGQEIWILSPKAYAELYKNRTKGEFNGRETAILAIDITHNIATAKASISMPSRNMNFIDQFLLKKLSGEWKIISKVATLLPNEE